MNNKQTAAPTLAAHILRGQVQTIIDRLQADPIYKERAENIGIDLKKAEMTDTAMERINYEISMMLTMAVAYSMRAMLFHDWWTAHNMALPSTLEKMGVFDLMPDSIETVIVPATLPELSPVDPMEEDTPETE